METRHFKHNKPRQRAFFRSLLFVSSLKFPSRSVWRHADESDQSSVRLWWNKSQDIIHESGWWNVKKAVEEETSAETVGLVTEQVSADLTWNQLLQHRSACGSVTCAACSRTPAVVVSHDVIRLGFYIFTTQTCWLPSGCFSPCLSLNLAPTNPPFLSCWWHFII